MSQDATQSDQAGSGSGASHVPAAAKSRNSSSLLRLAPRSMGPHPGRGLEAAPGWLSQQGQFSAEVVAKAGEMSTLKPESLTILVDIVNKCNLRCIMCHFSFDEVFYQRSQLMQPETFSAIAKSIRPYTRKLTLSAAYEPTASPHFGEILRIAGEHRFAEIGFLTNGNLLTDKLAETIVDSGVTELCVSVHAARSETYAHILRGGSLEKAIQNVEKVLELRRLRQSALPRVQFNVALMRSNVEELVEIIELAARLGVDAVAFRHLIVFEGLDMEAESLARHDKRHANRCIRQALLRAQELGVTLFNAADFFDIDGFEAHTQCVEMPAIPAAAEAQPADRGIRARVGAWLKRFPASPPPTAAPVLHGSVDTPAGDIHFYGESVELSGWALAEGGIAGIALARDPLPGDSREDIDADGLVPLGVARFHNATRPDVIRAFPHNRHAFRAGWSFTLHRRDLPQAADGLVVHVIARASNDHRLLIGKRRVSLGVHAGDYCHVRCHKPFDSLYIDARARVYPYPDCHTDQPFGVMAGQSFDDVWHDPRLAALRLDMVAGNAPGMCVRCPLFINRDVDDEQTFAPHADFSTETAR